MTGIVLVTGSGRGIGAATAKLAARRGWAVCINYLNNEARAREVADGIRAGGGRAILVQADTADEDAAVRIVNLSWIAAVIGGANSWTPYAAAKGAINSLTTGLSRELGGEGI